MIGSWNFRLLAIVMQNRASLATGTLAKCIAIYAQQKH